VGMSHDVSSNYPKHEGRGAGMSHDVSSYYPKHGGRGVEILHFYVSSYDPKHGGRVWGCHMMSVHIIPNME